LPIGIETALPVADQRPGQSEGKIVLAEEGFAREVASAGPGDLAVNEKQFPMIEPAERVTDADDFNVRLLRERADDAVDIHIGPMLRLAEDQIAAAVYQDANRQLRPRPRNQPGRHSRSHGIIFPLKHEHVDAVLRLIDESLKSG